MKNFFILLMVVLMLAGLTSTTFADNQNRTGDCDQLCVPVCGEVCPDSDCEPIGDGPFGPNISGTRR